MPQLLLSQHAACTQRLRELSKALVTHSQIPPLYKAAAAAVPASRDTSNARVRGQLNNNSRLEAATATGLGFQCLMLRLVGCVDCLLLLLLASRFLGLKPLHHVSNCVCGALLEEISTHALQQILRALQDRVDITFYGRTGHVSMGWLCGTILLLLLYVVHPVL
jgi:hypothetical protein